ncbi:MAG TPA: hypothetical protein VF585_01440 [Chthoniobacterales bacterium]
MGALLIGGGLFAYKKFYPYKIGNEKPSSVMGSIMKEKLPVLLGSLDGQSSLIALDMEPITRAINTEKAKAGPLQPAWNVASELSNQIQSVAEEREIALGCVRKNKGGVMSLWQSALEKVQTKEAPARRAFYMQDPEASWGEFSAQRREVLRKSYLKLVAAENFAFQSGGIRVNEAGETQVVRATELTCHLCKGEGRYMFRQAVGGSITDTSSICPLCSGKGTKALRLPAAAKTCADCKGFGRRIFAKISKKKLDSNKPGKVSELRSDDVEGEIFDEAPSSTGCTRCLSRGYVLQPRMK